MFTRTSAHSLTDTQQGQAVFTLTRRRRPARVTCWRRTPQPQVVELSDKLRLDEATCVELLCHVADRVRV